MVHNITGVINVLLVYGFHLLSGHSVLKKMFIRLKIKGFISETYIYFFFIYFVSFSWVTFDFYFPPFSYNSK